MARDPLASMRAEALARQESETRAAMLASPHDGPLPAPTPQASNSNDEALAAHLKETRESNEDYLKLKSEEARQQYENAVAENFRRTQEQKQEGAVRAAMENEQREVVDQNHVNALIQRAEELTATLPPDWTPW